jgi:hypothetical protein
VTSGTYEGEITVQHFIDRADVDDLSGATVSSPLIEVPDQPFVNIVVVQHVGAEAHALCHRGQLPPIEAVSLDRVLGENRSDLPFGHPGKCGPDPSRVFGHVPSGWG